MKMVCTDEERLVHHFIKSRNVGRDTRNILRTVTQLEKKKDEIECEKTVNYESTDRRLRGILIGRHEGD